MLKLKVLLGGLPFFLSTFDLAGLVSAANSPRAVSDPESESDKSPPLEDIKKDVRCERREDAAGSSSRSKFYSEGEKR
jgi:hypothetical protein